MERERRFLRFGGAGFTPDGKQLVIASFGKIHVVDTATGRERLTIPRGLWPWSRQFSFSPDGKLLVLQTQEKMSQVIELASGKQTLVLDGFGPIRAFAFSPDGQ